MLVSEKAKFSGLWIHFYGPMNCLLRRLQIQCDIYNTNYGANFFSQKIGCLMGLHGKEILPLKPKDNRTFVLSKTFPLLSKPGKFLIALEGKKKYRLFPFTV